MEWCITQDLQILSDWFRANKLILNTDKSTYILFKSGKTNATIDCLKFDNYTIPRCCSTKFLGILLDEKLTWHEHFNSLLLKIKRNIHLLRTSRNFINTHTVKLIYYGHIYSHLCYCISVWSNMLTNTSMKKLQKIQDWCIQLIDRNKIPIKNKYLNNRILRINKILLLENCKIGYKLLNKQLPDRVQITLSTDHTTKSLTKCHKHETRYKQKPNNLMVKGKFYKNSFLSACLNDLQPFMAITKKAKNIKHFTSLLKREFLT